MKAVKISLAVFAIVVVAHFSLLLEGWQLAWSFICVAVGYLLRIMQTLKTK